MRRAYGARPDARRRTRRSELIGRAGEVGGTQVGCGEGQLNGEARRARRREAGAPRETGLFTVCKALLIRFCARWNAFDGSAASP